MKKTVKKFNSLCYVLIIALILAYICGIFYVNFTGRSDLDFDIYSDTVLARYIASQKSLFPEGWHFGNQIYVVATPVVAGCLYPLVGDSYCAMAMASCLMTVFVIASFLWCVKPFSNAKSIAAGLLVLIGGTNIGWTAHADLTGLQVFYTMASYYACYIIGIFLTLGVYNRYGQGIGVKKPMLVAVVLLNLALGMQSLRETLVLNLPLCALSVFLILRNKGGKKTRKADVFAVAALAANLAGVITSKVLDAGGVFAQADILQETQPQLWDNVVLAISAFGQYIGLIIPNDVYTFFRFGAALLCIAIVAVALGFAAVDVCRKKDTVSTRNILFFLISLLAVFSAGILVLSLRPIYYFCWHLLVACCVMYLLEMQWSRCAGLLEVLKKLLVIALVCVSAVNFKYLFQYSCLKLDSAASFYREIARQLEEDGIRYLYTDSRTEQPMIATMSKDEVIYAPLVFSGDPEDFWKRFPYLYMEDWFDPANYEDAYILLTDRTLRTLQRSYSREYSDAFLENLQLVHQFDGNGVSVYLYRGTEKMYQGMQD